MRCDMVHWIFCVNDTRHKMICSCKDVSSETHDAVVMLRRVVRDVHLYESGADIWNVGTILLGLSTEWAYARPQTSTLAV
jgi:hypothetical protein